MVPELEDLQLRGIFDPAEVRALVKKRRDFEFLLQRRAPRKEDYVRYIEYELKLESLRKARTKRRGIHSSGPSDYSGIKRIQPVLLASQPLRLRLPFAQQRHRSARRRGAFAAGAASF